MAPTGALRPSGEIASYTEVIPSLALPHPAPRGDSRVGRVVSRVSSAEAVVGRVGALVASAAHSRLSSGDRTLLRSLAGVLALALASMERAAAWTIGMARPDGAWSITRRAATPIPVPVHD